ncbi:hypothetical protein [Bartonella sp. MM73XJBT]|uniref:hypothetical protein n=1 Tax=Bartonella sp. MM73XJBT TaxID=3019095 RepID=UPI002362FD46|nr:hypothetical protein [Bartonella sp. MM73XJBT]
MSISLNEVKDVIELAADELNPVRGSVKYAQISDVQVYQDELNPVREGVKYAQISDVQVYQDKLNMNGSLEL